MGFATGDRLANTCLISRLAGANRGSNLNWQRLTREVGGHMIRRLHAGLPRFRRYREIALEAADACRMQ